MLKRVFGARTVARLAIAIAVASAGAWTPIDARPRLPARESAGTAEGFSAPRLAALDAFVAAKVAKGDMAGAVVLIARHGRIVHLKSTGFADLAQRRPMTDDTIFRAYSMTKPVATVALMMLHERGLFQLDDPIADYLPEFANVRVLKTPSSPLTETVAPDRPPTIHDLLRHTAGFDHGWGDDAVNTEYRRQNVFGLDVTMKDMAARLARIPLRYQPGAAFHYSVGPDVAARLVEVLSGKPFDVFLRDELFAPLGMTDSGFWVDRTRAGRLATLYWRKDGKLAPLDQMHGYPAEAGFLAEPWTVNSYTRDHPRKGGSYGMVTTATDYWRFAQMLLDHGVFGGRRLLSPVTVDLMTRNHLTPKQKAAFQPGAAWGLGFGLTEDVALTGGTGSDGTFYWSGAANTHFWVDPGQDLIVVAMTQDMANPEAGGFRDEVKALVYGALTR